MKKALIIVAFLVTLLYSESKIEVLGTSTLHDWKMVSTAPVVEIEKNDKKINKLKVSVVIETLKSEDSALDDNAYEAIEEIKVTKKDSIIFNLIEHKENGSFDGVFSIGDKKLQMIVVPEKIDENIIQGSFKIKMSSFGIKPPSFLFGMMTTGDEVEIFYTISK